LKLTLDSSEPLEDAMRVVGALYDVELVVSGKQDTATASRSNSGRSGGKQTRSRKPSAASKPQQVARAAGANGRPSKQGTQVRSMGSSENAEVRAWARENGLRVSNRGRLPASVMTAYRDARGA
jgi:hypothetical protein